jgi:Flp pilus assembly protein TadG
MSRDFLKRLTSFRRDERGVQLVELAIVLPVMMLFFAAVAEFGRYFYEYTTLAKGSRVAVRYLATASTDGTDDAAAKNLVIYGNLAGSGNPILSNLTSGNVTITRRNSAGTPMVGGVPTTVTVEIVNYQHTPIFDLAGLTKTSATLAIAIKPSVTMRYLLTQPPI